MSGKVRVLVVMGVSGAGKTTLGRALAERLGWDFLEGDTLHPPANVAKMSAGQPLNDADRAPWLAAIADWIEARLTAGEGGVVACSALKRAYRDTLRKPGVRFVFIQLELDVATQRIAARRGHYMPASLAPSQFAALEPPTPDEPALQVDGAAPVEAEVDRVIAWIS